jgi:hypothetical protein
MCRDDSILEEDQAHQNRDRHPRNRVPDDDSVSEPAVGQQPVVLHQRTALQTFCHHGRLPGMLREVGGSRIGAASIFFRVHRSFAPIVSAAYRMAFDEQSRFTTTARR